MGALRQERQDVCRVDGVVCGLRALFHLSCKEIGCRSNFRSNSNANEIMAGKFGCRKAKSRSEISGNVCDTAYLTDQCKMRQSYYQLDVYNFAPL